MNAPFDQVPLGIKVMENARHRFFAGVTAKRAIETALAQYRADAPVRGRKWRMFEQYCWGNWQDIRFPWDLTTQPTDAAAFDAVIAKMTAQNAA